MLGKRRFWRRVGRVSAGFLCALFLLGGFFIWRVQSAPLVLPDMVRSTLISILQPAGKDAPQLRLASASLHWPDLSGPLYVQLEGIDLYSARGATEPLHLPSVGLALSGRALLMGQIKARGLVVRAPEITFIRAYDGSLSLDFGQTGGPHVREVLISQFWAKELDNPLKNLPDLEALLPKALQGLKYVEIRAVHLSAKTQKEEGAFTAWEAPPLDVRLARSDKGIALVFSTAKGEYKPYFAGQAAWYVESHDIRAAVEGNGLDLSGFFAAFPHLPPPGEAIPPLTLKARLSYRAQQKTLALEECMLGDGQIKATFSGSLVQGEDDVWTGQLEASLPGPLAQERIKKAWPHTLRYGAAHEWLADKPSKGFFQDVKAKANLSLIPGQKPFFKNAHMTMAFEGMALDYRAPLTPVTGVKGKGDFDADSEILALSFESGAKIADLTLGSGTVVIDHILTADVGRAKIITSLKGPLVALGKYLEPEPIGAKRYVDFDMSALLGETDLAITLDLPTQKNAKLTDIGITAQGKVRKATLPGTAGDMPLTNANLDVVLKDWLLSLKGTGTLLTTSVVLEHTRALQPFAAPFATQTKAQLTLDEDMRAHLGIALAPYITGPITANITHTQKADKSGQAQITADLTSSHLTITELGYTKTSGQAGDAILNADFSPGGKISRVRDLSVAAPDLTFKKGSLTFSKDGKTLTNFNLPHMVVGSTRTSLTYNAPLGKRACLTLKGSVIDAQAFLTPNLAGDLSDIQKEIQIETMGPLDISLETDVLRVGMGRAFSHLHLIAARENGGRFSRFIVHANAGPGVLDVRYEKGQFYLSASDFGATLAVLGHGGVEGGVVEIRGQEYKPGAVQGSVDIQNFTARRAPILAQLLGTMSLTGALNTLNGKGLSFDRLESGFVWVWRPQGALLTLKDGRTRGNALGLTFGGQYDIRSAIISLSGTIVPLSGISGLASKVPILGTIATGGGKGGGIFAATYSIRGTITEPQINVNPLSVLAPGILRRILFE